MENTAGQLVTDLHPLTELDPERFRLMQDKAQISKIAPNTRLDADDQCKWFVYVLSGNLVLTNDDDHVLISGGSSDSRTPLFDAGNTHGHAVSATSCTIIRFERQLFETLLNEEALEGYEVEDVQVNETESILFQELYAACANQDLHLPTMPEVAAKIAKLANDPEAGIPDLVRVIQTDPTVAGSILKAANSALYKGSSQIDNIKAAVIRLGLKITRDLATAIVLRQTFQTKNRSLGKRMRTAWRHSVNISAFSYIIAKSTAGMDPERALMAGLLHDIGAVAILTHVERAGLDPDTEDMDNVISKLRGMAGLLVLNNWGLDTDLEQVIEAAEDWWRDPGSKADYGDVVMVAHLCEAADSGDQDGLPGLGEIPAATRLGLDTSNDALEMRIIGEAEQELADIRRMLDN